MAGFSSSLFATPVKVPHAVRQNKLNIDVWTLFWKSIRGEFKCCRTSICLFVNLFVCLLYLFVCFIWLCFAFGCLFHLIMCCICLFVAFDYVLHLVVCCFNCLFVSFDYMLHVFVCFIWLCVAFVCCSRICAKPYLSAAHLCTFEGLGLKLM